MFWEDTAEAVCALTPVLEIVSLIFLAVGALANVAFEIHVLLVVGQEPRQTKGIYSPAGWLG